MHTSCYFVKPGDYKPIDKKVFSKVGVAMEQMSHVARYLIFTAGVDLMSTIQCNCNSRDGTRVACKNER